MPSLSLKKVVRAWRKAATKLIFRGHQQNKHISVIHILYVLPWERVYFSTPNIHPSQIINTVLCSPEFISTTGTAKLQLSITNRTLRRQRLYLISKCPLYQQTASHRAAACVGVDIRNFLAFPMSFQLALTTEKLHFLLSFSTLLPHIFCETQNSISGFTVLLHYTKKEIIYNFLERWNLGVQ